MMLSIIILLLTAFLTGFVCGKHYGSKNGYKQGIADAPLILRQQSLEHGCCTLCGKINN